MSSVLPARVLLVAQAAATAAVAVLGEVSGWTFATLLLGTAGAVFVAAALEQTPEWRWYVVGYEGLVVAYGLAALVSNQLVPGALAAAAALAWLSGGSAARLFAGAPTFQAPLPAVPAPAVPVPPAPRSPTLDVLPRR